MKSSVLRALAAGTFLLALFNPVFVREDREDIPDKLLVLIDQSDSMTLEKRDEAADQLLRKVRDISQQDPGLEHVEIRFTNSSDGTRLLPSLNQALATIPKTRLAGVLALTDGQIRDGGRLADQLDLNAPFHAFITGNPKARDRRLILLSTPRFGLVGETINFVLVVEDPGHEGESVQISLVLNGQDRHVITARIGEKVSFPIQLPHRGEHDISLSVDAVPEELTLINNHAGFRLEGVQDRLRVLLITGEPHAGSRDWRNLLKSDPSTDLVHFTILRPPGKSVMARREELALIPFPTHQLFQQLIEKFDLIVFDRYPLRGVLSPLYLDNIARYVEKGGGLLVTAGPPYAGSESLYHSPLAAVLPARPTGKIITKPFRPTLTDTGMRHPVTRVFTAPSQSWGRWARLIEAETSSGTVLMAGAEDHPLLILDRVGKGRVGILLSDQAWLWSRGIDGGGPSSNLFRRLVHWLMKEPELEEERLLGSFKKGRLHLERFSLSPSPQPALITTPWGENIDLPWRQTGSGHYTADLDLTPDQKDKIPAEDGGVWGIQSGDLSRFITEHPSNPEEYKNVKATPDKLISLAETTGGRIFNTGLQADAMPELRRVNPGARTYGQSFAGLIKNGETRLLKQERQALWPALLLLVAGLLALGAGWLYEGRTSNSGL